MGLGVLAFLFCALGIELIDVWMLIGRREGSAFSFTKGVYWHSAVCMFRWLALFIFSDILRYWGWYVLQIWRIVTSWPDLKPHI